MTIVFCCINVLNIGTCSHLILMENCIIPQIICMDMKNNLWYNKVYLNFNNLLL